VGEAVAKFKMIRDGDRVAVGVIGRQGFAHHARRSLLLQKRAPVDFRSARSPWSRENFCVPLSQCGVSEVARDRLELPSATILRSSCSKNSPTMVATCAADTGGARFSISREAWARTSSRSGTRRTMLRIVPAHALFNGRISHCRRLRGRRRRDFRMIRPLCTSMRI